MKNKILISLTLLLANMISVHAEEASSGFRAGPNMAVQEASLKEGFKLAEKAKEVIGVKTKTVGAKPYTIPVEALVYYGDKLGVYRLRNGWFKLIEIQKISKNNKTISLSSSELTEQDQVAITGVALLRVSEMDAFGGEQ